MKDAMVKLIWDFYGPDAEETAKHHQIHLQDYATAKLPEGIESGYDCIAEDRFCAWIAVSYDYMEQVRDALRPVRGEVYEAAGN